MPWSLGPPHPSETHVGGPGAFKLGFDVFGVFFGWFLLVSLVLMQAFR